MQHGSRFDRVRVRRTMPPSLSNPLIRELVHSREKKKEPRIRIGIPICGCPDYIALLGHHAKRVGIPLSPPYFPSSLHALIRAHAATTTTTAGEPVGLGDPASASVYSGKRLLVLSGADDSIVPWEVARVGVEALDVGRTGRKEVVLVRGAKHELTDEMRGVLFRFFWEEALVGGRTAQAVVRRCAL